MSSSSPWSLVRQVDTWDCGIACLKMVLNALKQHDDLSMTDLRRKIGVNSVWTIDLFKVLQDLDIDPEPTFCTMQLGASSSYSTLDYYSTNFSADEQRVNDLFDLAKDNDWDIENDSLPDQELIEKLNDSFAIIILVNKSTLCCEKCSKYKSWSYVGHYIVLISYDSETETFSYLDPAAESNHQCTISKDTLNTARMYDGTDQDLIIIRNPQ